MVAMHHLVSTLWPDSFVSSLCKKSTTNLDELGCRATKYMQLEELTKYTWKLRNKVSGSKKEAD